MDYSPVYLSPVTAQGAFLWFDLPVRGIKKIRQLIFETTAAVLNNSFSPFWKDSAVRLRSHAKGERLCRNPLLLSLVINLFVVTGNTSFLFHQLTFQQSAQTSWL